MSKWFTVWRLWAFLGLGALLLALGVTVGRDLVRGGLRPCDRLDERLCRDLGVEGCAVWTSRLARTGAASTQPHRFRQNRAGIALLDGVLHAVLGWNAAKADNPFCYDQLGDDLYPVVLDGIRQRVAHAPAHR